MLTLFYSFMFLGCPKTTSSEALSASSAEQNVNEGVEQKENTEENESAEENVGEEAAEVSQDSSAPPVVMGALDKSLIDEEIKQHMSKIKSCYQTELQSNPSLEGRIVVKFVIGKDGSVSSTTPKEDSIGSEEVTQCVLGQFQEMQFPEPTGGGVVIVSYPFEFSPG
ncbi:MAG: hypothetical protein CMK59_14075 [Proteobacteria bacterium]|nr:hypothetical protein [Pseudomonadota bacterium]